jgi:hypothetical protein
MLQSPGTIAICSVKVKYQIFFGVAQYEMLYFFYDIVE